MPREPHSSRFATLAGSQQRYTSTFTHRPWFRIAMQTFFDLNTSYFLSAIWLVLVSLLVLDARSRASSGLTLVYAANLIILYLPGGMLLMVPWYEYYPRNWTFNGFQLTTYGFAAFVAGVIAARFMVRLRKPEKLDTSPESAKWLGALLVGVGFGFTVLLGQVNFLFSIPSLGALLSAVWLAGAPGLCLYMHGFAMNQQRMPIHIYLIALGYPLLTVVFLGFLGFGLSFVVFIACFSVIQRFFPRMLIIAAPLILYVGVSVFVNYMGQRVEIRNSVYGGESISQRLDATSKIFEKFEWFDTENFFHLYTVDSRLNQNWLVGAAMESVNLGRTQLIDGDSIWFALVAWVPRAIWVNKPVVAGSGQLVANITGLTFDDQTSIGVGQVLELYMNFDVEAVLIGMFLIGFILRIVDMKATDYLQQNNVLMWLRWVLPGMALTIVGGAFSETVACIASFLIVGACLQYGVKRVARI
jgi:hypothetical protein